MPRSLAVFALLVMSVPAFADPKKPTYVDDVLPILKQHCINCHGNDKQRGGLNLAAMTTLMQGGSSGEVIKPGDPDKSRIYTLTAHKEEPMMPPSGQKIPDAQIEILRLWVEQGGRENSGSKAVMPDKPKVDISLKAVGKGKPDGPPPMPQAGKLAADPVVRGRRPGAVLAMAASPWAPLLAVGGPKQVLLYHSDTGDYLGSLPFEHGQVNNLKFSRNAKMLLAAGGQGGASGKAVLYNVETCEKVTEVGIETDALMAADISADQRFIAVGSPSKLVRIYNTSDGSVAFEIKKHTDWVTAVEFSPDGVLLATGDRNGGLFVWEANTAREFHALRNHTAMITDLSWRPDSNVLASGSEDGTIRLWEMENGGNIKNWGAHGGGVQAVKYSHDGRLVSTGRDRVTKLWDGNGGLQKQFEAFGDVGLQAAFAHTDATVIAGDWTGVMKFWTAADAKLVATADTNPLPFDDRLKATEAAFTAAEANRKQAEAALANAEAQHKAAQEKFAAVTKSVNQLTADLAAAQKALNDATAAGKAASDAVGPSKAEADQTAAAAQQLHQVVQAQQLAAGVYGKAAADLQTAASQASNNPYLAEQAKKGTDLAKTAQDQLEAAKKAHDEAAVRAKAAVEKYASVQKAAGDAASVQAEVGKKMTSIQQALTAAQAALAPAKAGAEQAAAALGPAKAAVEKVNADWAVVKSKLDRMKSGVASLK